MPTKGFPKDSGQTKAGQRYDVRHKRARAEAARVHSPENPCTRCGQPLGPMGPWLHYDHNDTGTGYLGFAHAPCNYKAGARRGRQSQREARSQQQRRILPRW